MFNSIEQVAEAKKSNQATQTKKFSNSLFGEIRTIIFNEDKNEPWFVLNEICKILGYADEAQTRKRLDEDECKYLKYKASELNTESMEINNLRELWGAN